MIKIFFLCTCILLNIATASVSTIEKKIDSNKKILAKNERNKKQTQYKIQQLSREISTQTRELKKIETKMSVLNRIIIKQKDKLQATKEELVRLEKKAEELKVQKKQSEEKIIDLVTDDFSWAFALDLASKKSLDELIDAELYQVLSQNSQDEIIRLNNQYMVISQNKVDNENEIKKLQAFINKELKRQKSLAQLQNKQEIAINSLEKKHNVYQHELKKNIKKQQSLASLLGKLNILKKEELKKQKERQRKLALEQKRRKEKQQNSSQGSQKRFAKNIDLDVRMLGSSTAGVKIGRYRGSKTIAPLKSYTVTKKFGKYYDPVYKIKLFNESVVLKSKQPKAKVYSVLNGKVVYAKKDSGMLENVVIVQHKNGLHTIYSHLDQISPTIKVGKWIQKGYVVGRVDDSLTFQATKNSAHINPQDLFN